MFASTSSSNRRLLTLVMSFALVLGVVPGWSPPPASAATTVFINEIHYDNDGIDAGEAIEIAGPAGTDLTGWSIVLYNGSGGAVYNTRALSGVLMNQQDGYGTAVFEYPSNGIQNGEPDGIALVAPGNAVAQFISYEGTFTAVGGPADGTGSKDIGVSEAGSEANGLSLQLTGTGLSEGDFTWSGPKASSFGGVNAGQVFDDPPPPPDDLVAWINEFHYDNAGTDEGEFIEIVATEETDLTGWSIVRYNGANGTVITLPEQSEEDDLGELIPESTTSGFSFYVLDYPQDGLQNGPDGFALLDDAGNLVQFLSYEGSFEATNGPIGGEISTDIGAAEVAADPVGSSLQLAGTGTTYSDFTWTRTSVNTAGGINTGQTLEGDDEEPVPPCETAQQDLTPIHEIQGEGSGTPINGASVTTRGVVTADFTSGGVSDLPENQGLRGFFIEARASDRDTNDRTSEGLFVFDAGGVFDGEIGDSVAVAGTATEGFGVTQVALDEFGVCGEDGTLPAPADLPLPTAPDDRDEVFEPLESMRVKHPELTVIEFFQLERFGEVRLSAGGVLPTPTNVHLPGSDEYHDLLADNLAAGIPLDDGRTGSNLNRLNSRDLLPYVREGGTLRIGDQLLDETFIVHWGFGRFPVWRLQPIDIDHLTDELVENRTRPRPEDPPSVGGTLKVASFNVLNYFDGDGVGGGFPTARGAVSQSELDRQTKKLVDAIVRLNADVYGLIEIENDGGEHQATRTLVNALNSRVGYAKYRFVNTGVIGTDEIKQAFIYNHDTTRPIGEFALLTSEVDPRFNDDRSRPALAQTFLRLGSGERITVVVNHFKSKSQSELEDETDPDFDQGDGQGFWNHTRTQSALALADWLESNPTGEEVIGALIIGDLNAYAREDPIRALEDAGYEDQLRRFSEEMPYTFTFDGMQGTLDTAMAQDSLATRITGAAVWHINADEVPAIDYLEAGDPDLGRFRTKEIADAYFDSSAFRSSDHDPVVIGVDLDRSKYAGGQQPIE